jgi:hypothetical protein
VKTVLLLVTLALATSHASANPLPSRDPQVVIPLLQAFHEHEGFGRIEQILGSPDSNAVSGFSITTFQLSDGTSVFIQATPSHNRIYTITYRAPGSLAETLYDPRNRDLRHPLPSSAPF